MNQAARIRWILKCVPIGSLAAFCLLLPWGLFVALFGNTWHGGDGQGPRLEGLQLWGAVICDALNFTSIACYDWCIVTIPVALFIAQRVYRKGLVSALNQDMNQKP
jgi:hypothetical protein